jgi:hypothetical protein
MTQKGKDAMIFRLSEKLKARIKVGALATLSLEEDPLTDWSCGLFLVGRSPYILLSNTKALYSTVLPGKGVTSETTFTQSALSGIRECLRAAGHEGVYERHIERASGLIRFARTLNRSITGSMTEMTKHAMYLLAEGDVSPLEIASQLNDTPMSALKGAGSSYGFPRDVLAEMVNRAG